jgi:hypothetical protein
MFINTGIVKGRGTGKLMLYDEEDNGHRWEQADIRHWK